MERGRPSPGVVRAHCAAANCPEPVGITGRSLPRPAQGPPQCPGRTAPAGPSREVLPTTDSPPHSTSRPGKPSPGPSPAPQPCESAGGERWLPLRRSRFPRETLQPSGTREEVRGSLVLPDSAHACTGHPPGHPRLSLSKSGPSVPRSGGEGSGHLASSGETGSSWDSPRSPGINQPRALHFGARCSLEDLMKTRDLLGLSG